MNKNNKQKSKDLIPEKYETIEEASEYWDSHSIADYWDQTQEAHFDVEIDERPRYIMLEKSIARKVFALAKEQKISPETLVNLILADKL
ncbi:hypothetical protein GF337_13575 [candidate division KSB1 bacterium]|nr:hypothetical protein [candidate division KSB1 bacterium]